MAKFNKKNEAFQMRKIYALAVLCSFFFVQGSLSRVVAQQVSGDLHFWQASDFLGFDEIGDCNAKTGDISAVFARVTGRQLLLRVTFDDMVQRIHNLVVADNFETALPELEVRLTRRSDRVELLRRTFDLPAVKTQKNGTFTLRTPADNLWEAEIPLPETVTREDLEFSIVVRTGGKVADDFLSDGRNSDAEGNCAFVHHGNQGITYTEVFYGSPGGQSGLDGSGFDEVLQVHEATGVPGNFHMSGTLMPAAQWHNPEFNDWLNALASDGLIEMMGSALGQHIMPFVQNNMNNWAVGIESDMVNFQYNYQPRTAWVPERVWLAPGNYPDAGVADWLGDNWTQHGIWGVVLDDSPHLNGYDNRKIHWMNNGMGISLRVIPINNSFVGNMHYNTDDAKNQIASMGHYNICVYGTDWEVAAEMNEHDGTYFLDNYENVIWWCHDNYPGVNVWKLTDAMQNPDFNGTGAEITPGTYGLLGGADGYGGSNNSWYTSWAGTASHSDFHDPAWNYGYIWDDAYNHLMDAPDNNLSQLAWYILMINLHETGWHDGGDIAGWEHRYSSHIKNANVYAEAARWADGQYEAPLAAYYDDIDRDGTDEVVMHNQRIFAVFESIGGKVNWLFYKDDYGNAHSVVGSDMAYWSETDGDYNESSNNHVAALSDVSPYQQDAVYEINIIQSFGDTVSVELSQWGVKKHIELTQNVNFLDVLYDFYGAEGYIKSGWSPGLLDLLWSGKEHVQRMWGDNGSYCGQRNSASGATVALVLGNGGGQHNTQFEGTLVLGDEIKGYDRFKTRLFAGYTSEPTGTSVPELNDIAAQNMDVVPPTLNPTAFQVDNNTIELTFSEAVEFYSAQNENNYSLEGFSQEYTLINAIRQNDWRKVRLTIQEYWQPGDSGIIVVTNVEDLNGNVIADQNTAGLLVPSGTTPHTIAIDGINDFDPDSELLDAGEYSLYLTWDNEKLYIGFENLNLNGGGDLFVNIDTDQVYGSGPASDSWGRVIYPVAYRAEYQVAIEGGGGSIQLNHFANGLWHYPASNNCESYEGWEQNGLTEIAVPWASLGNPDGVAISVHVTEEDNQVVTAAFPPENPTGNHPTFTHVYGYFIPYITSEMPMVGMEPNQVVTLPNTQQQIIRLPAGWSGISTYLTPEDPLVENLFVPVTSTDNLVILQNNSFMYWPAQGINTIDPNGGWNTYSGYQLKLNEEQELTVTGTPVADKTLTYDQAGWYLLPVLNACGAAPEDLFAGITDKVMIVKEIAGLRMFWPGVYQNLFLLEPGKSYAVRFTGAVAFTWPGCQAAKTQAINDSPIPDIDLNGHLPTAHSHVLAISEDALSHVHPGDQLEFTDGNGFTACRMILEDIQRPVALPLFGNDPTTTEKNGYSDHDQIRIILVRDSKSYQLLPDFDPDFDGDTWKQNGMSRIISFTMEPTSAAGHHDGLWKFYPNPVKNRLYLNEKNPYSNISIFTADGHKVVESQTTQSFVDVSALKPGLYFVKMKKTDGVSIGKFVKQ